MRAVIHRLKGSDILKLTVHGNSGLEQPRLCVVSVTDALGYKVMDE